MTIELEILFIHCVHHFLSELTGKKSNIVNITGEAVKKIFGKNIEEIIKECSKCIYDIESHVHPYIKNEKWKAFFACYKELRSMIFNPNEKLKYLLQHIALNQSAVCELLYNIIQSHTPDLQQEIQILFYYQIGTILHEHGRALSMPHISKYHSKEYFNPSCNTLPSYIYNKYKNVVDDLHVDQNLYRLVFCPFDLPDELYWQKDIIYSYYGWIELDIVLDELSKPHLDSESIRKYYYVDRIYKNNSKWAILQGYSSTTRGYHNCEDGASMVFYMPTNRQVIESHIYLAPISSDGDVGEVMNLKSTIYLGHEIYILQILHYDWTVEPVDENNYFLLDKEDLNILIHKLSTVMPVSIPGVLLDIIIRYDIYEMIDE